MAEIQVVPDAMSLAVGERRPVMATLFDRGGQVVTGVTPTFTTTDSNVVTVSPRGVVTATGPGLAVVDVRVGDRGAVVAVSVRGNPLPPGMEQATRLVPNHATLTLLPGEEAELGTAALRADGSAVGPVTATWRAADDAVAGITGTRVRGLRTGTTTLTASVAGLEATVPVEVAAAGFAFARVTPTLAPGERDTLRVVVPAQAGRSVVSGLTWTSSDTGVVIVTPEGVARGVRPGRAEAIVTGYGQQGRLPLVVHAPVEAVVANPGPSHGALVVPSGAAVAVTVRAEDAAGQPVEGAVVRWQVADTAVALMDTGTGQLRGLRPGTTRLLARVHGFAPLEWTVRVVTGRLVLQPGRTGAVPGDTVAMEAMLLDETGTAFAAPGEARWSVSDASVVGLSPDGQLVARAPGRAGVDVTTAWGARAAGEVIVGGRLLASTGERSGGLVQGSPGDLTELTPLVVGLGPNAEPARSRDGTRLAWTSARDGDAEVYVADADGRNAQRLTTNPGYDAEPAWLPGADGVVFVSARGGHRALWLDRLDGNAPIPVGTSSDGERRRPAVSPDGATVAALKVDGRRSDVVLVELASGAERALPATPEQERVVGWAGEELVVAQERSSAVAVLLVNPASGVSRLVHEAQGRFGAMAVSPDGTRAALLVSRSDGARLLVVPLAGGPPDEVRVPEGMTLRELDLQ